MRENRPYGSEGGESHKTLPDPYQFDATDVRFLDTIDSLLPHLPGLIWVARFCEGFAEVLVVRAGFG
jgi:hypothetical protein